MTIPPERGANGRIMSTTLTTTPADTGATGKPTRLSLWAVLLSSMIIPFPILVSTGLEAILDGVNPAGVDVSQPLAYLRELLGYGFGLLALLLLAVAVVCVLLYRQSGRAALTLPLAIIIAQVVVGIAILLLNGAVDGIEDAYVAGGA